MATITETLFSDIYITPEKKAFIPDRRTINGLALFEPEDFEAFYQCLEEGYKDGNTSYSINYNNILYRVERSASITGPQYCCRKMPPKVPIKVPQKDIIAIKTSVAIIYLQSFSNGLIW